MKKAVFWNVAQCRYCVNRRFGGMYLHHLQGRRKKKIRARGPSVCRDISLLAPAHAGSSLADFLLFSSTLKMEAIRSSEASVNTKSTRRHIPENCFLRILRCYGNPSSSPSSQYHGTNTISEPNESNPYPFSVNIQDSNIGSRDSSVGIETGYGLDDPSPSRDKNFLFFMSGAHPASCSMDIGGSFPGSKAPGA
jgi:hypothetical protein